VFAIMSNGDELLAKANKRANASGGFGSLFSGGSSSKFEEARDLYIAAANSYKLDKRWKESGDAFCKGAEMAIKAEEKDDAANDYWNASKSYKRSNPECMWPPLCVFSYQSHCEIYNRDLNYGPVP
jgi:alpha-soluble NSF attachment protein